MSKEIHKCGTCEGSFKTEAEYLEHKCDSTGHKPTEVAHQDTLTGGKFSKASEAALKRGEARKGEKTHPAAGK